MLVCGGRGRSGESRKERYKGKRDIFISIYLSTQRERERLTKRNNHKERHVHRDSETEN